MAKPVFTKDDIQQERAILTRLINMYCNRVKLLRKMRKNIDTFTEED